MALSPEAIGKASQQMNEGTEGDLNFEPQTIGHNNLRSSQVKIGGELSLFAAHSTVG
jgi:hypothetical protein